MFGEILRRERTRRGFTQADIAKYVGFTQQAVAKWEKGENEPDNNTIGKIADLFGVSADLLIGRMPGEKLPTADNMRSVAMTEKEKTGWEWFLSLPDDQQAIIFGEAVTRYSQELTPAQRQALMVLLDGLSRNAPK